MRVTVANRFAEAHGQPMRCIDWIAPVGVKAADVPALIEAAVPGLKVFHRGDFNVKGYVNTSLLPDGRLYISLQLYDTECLNRACPGGHGPVNIRRAPPVTVPQFTAIALAVGEDPGAIVVAP